MFENEIALLLKVLGPHASAIVIALMVTWKIVEKQLEKRAKKRERIMKRFIALQASSLYSDAYHEMQELVIEADREKREPVDVHTVTGTIKTGFGRYLSNYQFASKAAEKSLAKVVWDYVLEDRRKYSNRKKREAYCIKTAEDIRKFYIHKVGKESGTTKFNETVEKESLNDWVFLNFFETIIDKAIEN